MRLTNHIAWRFLNDEKFLIETLECFAPEIKYFKEGYELAAATISSYQVLSTEGNVSYYITNSVTDKLSLLKVKRKNGLYDYTVFKKLKNQKKTFIMPDNRLIRMWVQDESIAFFYLTFKFHPGSKNEGVTNNVMFYVDRTTNEHCSHFAHSDVQEIEDYLYKLLCFIFLSDTEEILIQPNQSYGTRKTGKLLNEIKHPLIVVNSRWNVTSVRTDKFGVSGHFRLQPYKTGHEIIWIDPFEKNGYIRRAKSETQL